MKTATYNIWNSENGMPYRSKYIADEIQKIKADLICLQEVYIGNRLKILLLARVINIGILIIIQMVKKDYACYKAMCHFFGAFKNG